MSHKKYFTLGLLPVLGLMLMSPSSIKRMHSGRSLAAMPSNMSEIQKERQRIHEEAIRGTLPLAPIEGESVTVPAPAHPKVDAISKTYQAENKHVVDNDLSRETYVRNLESIIGLISDEEKSLEPELKDLEKIREAQNRIEGQVHAVSKAEKDLDDLKTRNLIKAGDEKKPDELLISAKVKLENLLGRLDSAKIALSQVTSTLVATSEVVAVEVKPAETVKSEAKEGEKEDKPKVGSREARRQRAEAKSEMYDLLCELRDQNKAMNENMQKLIQDQTNIMNQMMGMMQSMVASQQAQQQLKQSESLYQYHPQYPQGNWVFVPNGFQPSPSIFGQLPAYQQQNLYGQAPVYNGSQGAPSAAASGAWSLVPDQSLQFQDPRMSAMQTLSPGVFGENLNLGPFGFNLNPAPSQPRVPSSEGQPMLQQLPFHIPSTSPQLGGPVTLV